jgi:hypothetical protein
VVPTGVTRTRNLSGYSRLLFPVELQQGFIDGRTCSTVVRNTSYRGQESGERRHAAASSPGSVMESYAKAVGGRLVLKGKGEVTLYVD